MATAGDLLQWHPHLHLIATDAGRVPDGSWHALQEWDGLRLMTLLRERLLARLDKSRAISKELVARLLAWRHPGFSAHVGKRIAPEEKHCLLDTAAYLVRNPVSLGHACRKIGASLDGAGRGGSSADLFGPRRSQHVPPETRLRGKRSGASEASRRARSPRILDRALNGGVFAAKFVACWRQGRAVVDRLKVNIGTG